MIFKNKKVSYLFLLVLTIRYILHCLSLSLQNVASCTDSVIDVDDLVLTLQEDFPEYGRRKRRTFRALVARVCSSLSPIRGECGSEEWLERREKEHVLRQSNGGQMNEE